MTPSCKKSTAQHTYARVICKIPDLLPLNFFNGFLTVFFHQEFSSTYLKIDKRRLTVFWQQNEATAVVLVLSCLRNVGMVEQELPNCQNLSNITNNKISFSDNCLPCRAAQLGELPTTAGYPWKLSMSAYLQNFATKNAVFTNLRICSIDRKSVLSIENLFYRCREIL